VIEFDGGSRRVIYANHWRKSHIRMQCVIYNSSLLQFDCNSCDLVSDQDNDFGELDVLDMVNESVNAELLSSQMTDTSMSRIAECPRKIIHF